MTSAERPSTARVSLYLRPWDLSPGSRAQAVSELLFELELRCPPGTTVDTVKRSVCLTNPALKHLLLVPATTRKQIRTRCRALLEAAFPVLQVSRVVLTKSVWEALSSRIIDLLAGDRSAEFRSALDKLLTGIFRESIDTNDLLQQLSSSCVLDERRFPTLCRQLAPSIIMLEFPEDTKPGLVADLVADRLEPGSMEEDDAANEAASFSGRENSFANRIYRNDKGRLRIDLLLEDLEPLAGRIIRNPEPALLDIGCGEAGIAARLLPGFARVDCLDSAAGMLKQARRHVEIARDRISRQPAGASSESPVLQFIESDAMQMLESADDRYDLILAHALLEWTDRPFDLLGLMIDRLKPDGALSLAVYNEHGLLFRRLIGGRLDMPLAPRPRHFGGGFTPIYPIRPEEIEAWCADNNYRIESYRGLRCMADYRQTPLGARSSGQDLMLEGNLKKEISQYEALLEAERKLSTTEPFWRMARYLHFIISRAN